MPDILDLQTADRFDCGLPNADKRFDRGTSSFAGGGAGQGQRFDCRGGRIECREDRQVGRAGMVGTVKYSQDIEGQAAVNSDGVLVFASRTKSCSLGSTRSLGSDPVRCFHNAVSSQLRIK